MSPTSTLRNRQRPNRVGVSGFCVPKRFLTDYELRYTVQFEEYA